MYEILGNSNGMCTSVNKSKLKQSNTYISFCSWPEDSHMYMKDVNGDNCPTFMGHPLFKEEQSMYTE